MLDQSLILTVNFLFCMRKARTRLATTTLLDSQGEIYCFTLDRNCSALVEIWYAIYSGLFYKLKNVLRTSARFRSVDVDYILKGKRVITVMSTKSSRSQVIS